MDNPKETEDTIVELELKVSKPHHSHKKELPRPHKRVMQQKQPANPPLQ